MQDINPTKHELKKRLLQLFAIMFCTFSYITVYPQNPEVDVYSLNINELSKLKVVSVSKIEQNVSEVSTTVRIISSKDIEERGYFTFEEMLSDLSGFQFRNILSFNSYTFQRGIPNQNNLILVLIDGIQINELNSGGFYAGGQYDLSSIDRVEVVYGPSSVTYGTNAISGVINIITKKAESNTCGVNSIVGNFKTYNTSAYCNVVSENKQFRLRLNTMVKTSAKANLKGSAGDDNWTDLLDNFEDDYNVGVKASYKNFTFGTNYMLKQSAVSTFQKSVGTALRDFGSSWNIQFINSYLKYNKRILDKINWQFMVYNRNATVLKSTIYSVTDTAQIAYYRPNNLSGIENIFSFNLKSKFEITGGVLFEYEKLAESAVLTYSNSMYLKPPEPASPDFQRNELLSLYIEPRLNLFSKLFLSGGVRVDYSTIYHQILTPRLGLNYNSKKITCLVSYAEAFRAPKPWDYYDGIGNPALLPETMKSTEMAVRYHISKRISSQFIIYYNQLQNGIVKEYLNNKYHWINSGVIQTNGFEFNFDYTRKKLNSNINYTYTNSVNENSELLAEISKHCANVSCTYFFNNKIKANLRANYVGKRKNPKIIESTKNDIVDPYLVLNGALTWKPNKSITFQLIGKNILNKEYYHTSNREPDRYRQPQQTILLSVAYKFDNL